MTNQYFLVLDSGKNAIGQVVYEDDETKTGHHQNEVWGEKGQTGPIQKRKGPSKIIVIQLVLQLDLERSLF